MSIDFSKRRNIRGGRVKEQVSRKVPFKRLSPANISFLRLLGFKLK